MRLILCFILCLCVSTPADALVSRKDQIIIRSAISSTDDYIRRMQEKNQPTTQPEESAPVGDQLPWLAPKEETAESNITEHLFTVMMRSQLTLRQPSIVGLGRLDDSEGIMVVLNHVTELPLIRMKNYTPVDVLFIDESGEILQIAPEIILSELDQDVQAYYPVKAFLYLKSGTSVVKSIRPGDVIVHPTFKAKPTVLR